MGLKPLLEFTQHKLAEKQEYAIDRLPVRHRLHKQFFEKDVCTDDSPDGSSGWGWIRVQPFAISCYYALNR